VRALDPVRQQAVFPPAVALLHRLGSVVQHCLQASVVQRPQLPHRLELVVQRPQLPHRLELVVQRPQLPHRLELVVQRPQPQRHHLQPAGWLQHPLPLAVRPRPQPLPTPRNQACLPGLPTSLGPQSS